MRPKHRVVRGKVKKDHLADNSLQLERYQPLREYSLGEIMDELAKIEGYRA